MAQLGRAPLTPHHALRRLERSLREHACDSNGASTLDPEVEEALTLLWDVVVLGRAGQDEPDDRDALPPGVVRGGPR